MLMRWWNINMKRKHWSPLIDFSFSYKDLGVIQSLHGNVYKDVNWEGQVTDECHALQVELA